MNDQMKSLLLIVLIIVVGSGTLFGGALMYTYVLYRSAPYNDCMIQRTQYVANGWTCGDCSQADNGLYSLWCDEPSGNPDPIDLWICPEGTTQLIDYSCAEQFGCCIGIENYNMDDLYCELNDYGQCNANCFSDTCQEPYPNECTDDYMICENGNVHTCVNNNWQETDVCQQGETCVEVAYDYAVCQSEQGGYCRVNNVCHYCSPNFDYATLQECQDNIPFYCLSADRTECNLRYGGCYNGELSYSGTDLNTARLQCEGQIGSGDDGTGGQGVHMCDIEFPTGIGLETLGTPIQLNLLNGILNPFCKFADDMGLTEYMGFVTATFVIIIVSIILIRRMSK